MSKRIVFLYCTQKNKENLLQYETVIRALLRKFRRSALFSYLQMDPSPACCEKMTSLLRNEMSRSGSIFLECDEQNASACTDLLKNVFGFYAVSHHISGRTLCYPEQVEKTQKCDEEIIRTTTCKKDDMCRAIELSIAMAKAKKHCLYMCLGQSNGVDYTLLDETQIKLGKEKHLSFEYFSLDEMISLCVKTVPPFDTVLTSKECASLIAMHLNSMPDIPSGYIVNHGESHNIYKRQILPLEEMSNLHHFSSLLAIAALFENEFKMKNAADWLRRALSLAFMKESGGTSRDFMKSVTDEINAPIRKRRTE